MTKVALDLVHIIVVEDNPYDAEFIIQGFRQCDPLIRARVMVDGQSAVDDISAVCKDAIARSFLRLVLLDLKLPKVSGLEVLRRLRAEETTKDVPVVIFTSSSEEGDRVECQRLGASEYVVKPVGFRDFLTAIGRLHTTWVDEDGQ
jgi:DNA-binding response OmpR family regulator